MAGLVAGSVTADKLNANVLSPGGLSFDINNAIQNGFVARTSGTTAAARTMTSSDPTKLLITNGDGVSGNPIFSFPSTFFQVGTFNATAQTPNNDIAGVSYIIRDRNYQRIGNWVMMDLEIVFTATGGTGNLIATGLPIAAIGIYWFASYLNSANLTDNQQVGACSAVGT